MTRVFYMRVLIFLLIFLPGMMLAQPAIPYIQLLGIAQDGGYPHAGCNRKCCNMAWANDSMRRYVVSLALVDPVTKQWWLFEATPDIKEQLHYFQQLTKGAYNYLPSGIFITHAHIGHYTGLMQLGREVMSTKDVPVYVMPGMQEYLQKNGPWSQLVTLHNIILKTLDSSRTVQLTPVISVDAFTVPHRDEYSETAGFRIKTSARKYLFIPDINKWEHWNKSIMREIEAVDVVLVDATFYDDSEVPERARGVVLHPYVQETVKLFDKKSAKTKGKLYLIHMNHTNPLMWDRSVQKRVEKQGFHIAAQGAAL